MLKRGAHEVTAVAVYGLALLTMFGFSAAYNLVPPSSLKWLLRRFDHSAIFIMIAGTYMPLLVLMQDSFWALLPRQPCLDRRPGRLHHEACLPGAV